MRRVMTVLGIILCICPAVLADVTIHADGTGDFPSIQEGIDNVSSGETVWLSDGIYQGSNNRNLDYASKSITVRSISDDPANCVIDAEGIDLVFYFDNSESNDAIVRGVGIHNGYSSGNGGGIYANGSSPTVINCYFTGNDANRGGAFCSINTSMRMYDCIFHNNTAAISGGGFINYNTPTLSNCVFSNNVSDGTTNDAAGLGITNASPVITNCLFVNNQGGHTGALRAHGSSFSLTNCTFFQNDGGTEAGALRCSGTDAVIDVINCIFFDNTTVSNYEIELEYEDQPCTVNISYSDVQGGQSAVAVAANCTLNWGAGMLDVNPLFVTGPAGDFYLSSIATGHGMDSLCLDAGSAYSGAICYTGAQGSMCISETTTRTDHFPDVVAVDLGYHTAQSVQATPIPTITPTATEIPTDTPTATPSATITPTPTETPLCLNDGDVNNSLTLSAGDAQMAFEIVLGMWAPTAEERCSADCNGDGSITAGDSQTIFFAVLGLESCVDDIFIPTATPTVTPTDVPTDTPTATPTITPTNTPTATPTCIPYNFSTSFSTMPIEGTLYGDAYHQISSEYLSLTDAIDDQSGVFILTGTDCPLDAFSVSFMVFVGGGSSADGFSLNFAGDLPSGVFAHAEEGAGTGLIVSCDTFTNSGEEPAPRITLRNAGVDVADQSVELETDSWVEMELLVADQMATLYHDGNLIFDQVALGEFAPEAGWQFAWAARTGGSADNHWIDDIHISDYTVEGTPTPTNTPVPTNTPTATPSNTPTSTPTFTPTPTEILDQFSTTSNEMFSSSNHWQSFTAGATGVLSRIQVSIGGSAFTNGVVTIYSGEGTSGTVLATETGQNGSVYTWMNVDLSELPDVNAGSVYTLALSGDTCSLYTDNRDSYAGGRSNASPERDACFKTYVILP